MWLTIFHHFFSIRIDGEIDIFVQIPNYSITTKVFDISVNLEHIKRAATV